MKGEFLIQTEKVLEEELQKDEAFLAFVLIRSNAKAPSDLLRAEFAIFVGDLRSVDEECVRMDDPVKHEPKGYHLNRFVRWRRIICPRDEHGVPDRVIAQAEPLGLTQFDDLAGREGKGVQKILQLVILTFGELFKSAAGFGTSGR